MSTTRQHALGASKFLAIGFLALAMHAVPVEASTVSLSPASPTIGVGGLLTLDLNISGLGGGTALGAYDVSVNFDPAYLTYNTATFGDPVLGDQLDLSSAGINGPTATADTGTVNLVETDLLDSPTALLSGQATSFTIGVLSFIAVAGGTTPVTVSVNSLADQDGSPVSASLQSATVIVTAVPLPAGFSLFLSGLLASLATFHGSTRKS